jgi:hypothetical protein
LGRLARKTLKLRIDNSLHAIDRNAYFLKKRTGQPAFLSEQRRQDMQRSYGVVPGLGGGRLGVDHRLLNFNC